MSIKHKIRNLVAPLYNKVWHGPKGKIRERLKKACDDLPKNQRLMVVTVLFSVFVQPRTFLCFPLSPNFCSLSRGCRFAVVHLQSLPG